MHLVLVDLGTSNIRSLSSALEYLGVAHVTATEPGALSDATHVILPGVGAFDAAIARLDALDLRPALVAHARDRQRPLLGVCLGMQLLFDGSEEGERKGLGLVPGVFRRLTAGGSPARKVPHVGFAPIHGYGRSRLFAGLGEHPYFYFTHSYALPHLNGAADVAVCDHAQPFVAAFQQGSVCGAQFHPEKSQSNGLRLLSNFLELGSAA